jgi:hypothetical protein
MKTVWVILDEKDNEIGQAFSAKDLPSFTEYEAWKDAISKSEYARSLNSGRLFWAQHIELMKSKGWHAAEMRLVPKEPLMPNEFMVVLDPQGLGLLYVPDANEMDESEAWNALFEGDVELPSHVYADLDLARESCERGEHELAEDYLKERGYVMKRAALWEVKE